MEIHHDTDALLEELEQFRKEKEKIRDLVGKIGGAASTKRNKAANIIFVSLIIGLLCLDILRHLVGVAVPLPPLFSLEAGILLVSIKIIWMIHKQTKVEHFQFWILNSIEYRLNDISNKIQQIEKNTESKK